jgi:hypothetical protein
MMMRMLKREKQARSKREAREKQEKRREKQERSKREARKKQGKSKKEARERQQRGWRYRTAEADDDENVEDSRAHDSADAHITLREEHGNERGEEF